MTPYFADHVVTFVLTVATVLAWVGVDLPQSRHRRRGRGQDRGSYVLLVLCVVGTCAIGL